MDYPGSSRQMMRYLRREGVTAGRHRIRRLRSWGWSRPTGAAHERGELGSSPITSSRADHVWCADITYIPVTQGFFYLVAVMDWELAAVQHDGRLVLAPIRASPEILNTDRSTGCWVRAWRSRLKYEAVPA